MFEKFENPGGGHAPLDFQTFYKFFDKFFDFYKFFEKIFTNFLTIEYLSSMIHL